MLAFGTLSATVTTLAPMAIGDTTGLSAWLKSNVVGVLLIVIAIVILSRAGNKDHKGAVVTVGIVLIGLSVLGLAAGDGAQTVGTWLSHTLFGA